MKDGRLTGSSATVVLACCNIDARQMHAAGLRPWIPLFPSSLHLVALDHKTLAMQLLSILSKGKCIMS